MCGGTSRGVFAGWGDFLGAAKRGALLEVGRFCGELGGVACWREDLREGFGGFSYWGLTLLEATRRAAGLLSSAAKDGIPVFPLGLVLTRKLLFPLGLFFVYDLLLLTLTTAWALVGDLLTVLPHCKFLFRTGEGIPPPTGLLGLLLLPLQQMAAETFRGGFGGGGLSRGRAATESLVVFSVLTPEDEDEGGVLRPFCPGTARRAVLDS